MKALSSHSYQSGVWRRHILSILVWAGAAAVVVGLFHKRSERFEVLGITQGETYQIAATITGRVKSMPVQLFERVTQGQRLVVLDDEQLLAELGVVSAEIQHLMAELIATQDRLVAEAAERETDKVAAQRRFAVDVESARLRILELTTVLETDRLMLKDMALEMKIAQELLEQDAIAPYEQQKIQLQYDALAKKIEENQHVLALAKQDLRESQRRQDEFAILQPLHPSVGSALDVIRKVINVQEHRVEQLLVTRDALVLTSPVDGVVSQILSAADGAVVPAQPILTVVTEVPRDIVVYASENQFSQIRERMNVRLAVRSTDLTQVANSQVVHIGPVVELMPNRLWRSPNIPEWGRPVLIKIPPGLKLVPGELVGVKGL